MAKTLESIRDNARHGKRQGRNARTKRYSSARKPPRMEATRLTPDVATAQRNRKRLQTEDTDIPSAKTARHGTVTKARKLSERDGMVTAEITIWGLGEPIVQTMPKSDYISITSSL